jgi:ADP-ribose pyrophosphatase
VNLDDHPKAAELGWKLRSSRTGYENEILRLREDHFEVPGSGGKTYAYVERGPAVIIVPVTAKGEIILLRQYRYPVDEYCLEVPAGTARDAGDLSLEEVAAKELKEEIGATYSRMESVGSFFSNNALSDESCHVFVAFDVVLAQRPEPEATEEIEAFPVPAGEAIARVRRGEMKTGPAALAMLLCEPKLRERGFLE